MRTLTEVMGDTQVPPVYFIDHCSLSGKWLKLLKQIART